MRRRRRVTVGELGVEVDKVGEESLSFTGNAGCCLGFDGMLRRRGAGVGCDRRRLLWCRNADLASEGVSLADNAAAIDIDVASDACEGTLFASDTVKLCEDIRCWDCSSSASLKERDGASEQVASAAGRQMPSFEDCWLKESKERVEEAVDTGAAIVRGKWTSLLAKPLFCRRADARLADRPASNCGASAEVEEAAKADEGVEDVAEEDDEARRGTREGAMVRRVV